jgi:hypothetical protein
MKRPRNNRQDFEIQFDENINGTMDNRKLKLMNDERQQQRRHVRTMRRHQQGLRPTSATNNNVLSTSWIVFVMTIMSVLVVSSDASNKFITTFDFDPMASVGIHDGMNGVYFEDSSQQLHRQLKKQKKRKKRKRDDDDNKNGSSSKEFSSSSSVESKPVTTASLFMNEESNNIDDAEEEVCHSAGKCQQCTFSEMKTYDACEETGRWERYECFLTNDSPKSSRIELRSCKYTEADEEFAMVCVHCLYVYTV